MKHVPENPAENEAWPVAYRRVLRRRVGLILALLAVCILGGIADIAIGPAGLTISDVVIGLFLPSSADVSINVIVREIRLPVAGMALLVGASLALAGAEMQTILSNPLAEPFTLGVSSSAALGAALAIIFSIGIPGVPAIWILAANSFLFAFGSVLLLLFLARIRGAGPETLILFGIVIGLAAGAILSFIQFLAPAEALQQLVFWSMGSLARADWQSASIIALVLVLVAPFSLAASWKLTVLRLGRDRAQSFGVDVNRLRLFALVRISLLAATAVAFVGIIGFVGLVGPHIARMLVGEDHRFLLPASILTGAAVMSLASIASKSLIPGVLVPIGIVTTLVGLPVLLWLIMKPRGGA